MIDVANAVVEYIRLGIAPIPVPLRSKGPALNGWQHLRITEAEVPKYFGKPTNIGVILGEASGGLVDFDLDCPEAVALAPYFLPPTDAVFGRASKPRSHWMYRSDLIGGGHGAKITTLDDKGKEVCALRIGDGDESGAQTIVPPSLHKDTGELIEWYGSPKLTFEPGDKLIAAHRHLSVASLLAQVWPREQGSRNQIALAAGGALAARGVPLADAVEIVSRAAAYAGDDQVKMREDAVKGSYKKQEKGEAVTGLPKLKELLANDKAVKRISDALGTPKSGPFPNVTKDGFPRPTLPNTKKAIELLGIEVRFDLFKLQQLLDGQHLDSYFVGTVSDPALFRIRELIYDNFGFDPPTNVVYETVQMLANHRRFHPVRDYLDSLVWDGQPRLDCWLVSYAGAEDTPFIRAVGSLTLSAAVRRVRQPGVKFDEWLILEGEQGSGKSQALQILAVDPKWFTDQKIIGLSGKEAIEAMSGKWIIEAAELHGMPKSSVEALKAFMSRDTDRGRMAYARTPTEGQRQCIVIGTTNSDKYLRDLTGNRRMWPVVTTKFDLEALKRDRDQLWAEASVREAEGVSIRLPEELWPVAAEQQQQRVIDNPFTATLDEVLRTLDEPIFDKTTNKRIGTKPGGPMNGIITMENVWTAVGVRPERRSQYLSEQLAAAMKELGWTKSRNRVEGGRRAYSYKRGDDDRHIMIYPGDHGDRAMASYGDKMLGPGY